MGAVASSTDASLVEADASNSSVIDLKSLKGQLHQRYQELEARLEEIRQAEIFEASF